MNNEYDRFMVEYNKAMQQAIDVGLLKKHYTIIVWIDHLPWDGYFYFGFKVELDNVVEDLEHEYRAVHNLEIEILE